MENEMTPYKKCNPGDLITAEECNEVQVNIKEDIAEQVGQVKNELEEFKTGPIDASTFDGKTSEEWTGNLDERYAPLEHLHNGVIRYRRYFLELETVVLMNGTSPDIPSVNRLQPAVVIHNMGRNPVVQVYVLQDLPIAMLTEETPPREYKFCICGPEHSIDPEAMSFKTKSWDERHWGDPIDKFLENIIGGFNKEEQKAHLKNFKDNFTLSAWLANLEALLFEPGPAQYHFDMGDVYLTKWVKDRKNKKVEELKDSGEWPPRFVYRPRLINQALFEVTGVDEDGKEVYDTILVDIFHLNLNEVEIGPHTNIETHLMVILRA